MPPIARLTWLPGPTDANTIVDRAINQLGGWDKTVPAFGKTVYTSLGAIQDLIKQPPPPPGTPFQPFQGAGSFQAYDMQNAEAACSKVRWYPYGDRDAQEVTTLGMHAEMLAIDRMVTAGHWAFDDEGLVYERQVNNVIPGGWVQPANYVTYIKPKGTDELVPAPHCGYCTIICFLLGLPLTIPSNGASKLIGQLRYALPKNLTYTEDTSYSKLRLIERLYLSQAGSIFSAPEGEVFHGLKRILNDFSAVGGAIAPTEWQLECDPNSASYGGDYVYNMKKVVKDKDKETVIPGREMIRTEEDPENPVLAIRTWKQALDYVDNSIIPMIWRVLNYRLTGK